MLSPLLDPGLAKLPPERRPDYEWEEPKVLGYFLYAEKTAFDRLNKLTRHANMALALAITEWIEAWLAPFEHDHTLEWYIEAGWAALLDRAHTQSFRIDEDEWRGPVRGAMVIGIGIINEVFFESFDEPRMAFRSCYATNLARHVMGRHDPFEWWLEQAIVRLETLATAADQALPVDLLAKEYPKGALVAREALILAAPYEPAEAETLLRRQMARIGPANPFFDPAASAEIMF